nr:IS21-like element helper ATPase IstB [Methylocystis iwaonis]
MTLKELQGRLAERGHRFSIGALWRFFDRHDITWKKDRSRERTRPAGHREASPKWFDGRLDLDPEKLVFIDETWATTNMARKNGRAPKGERLRASVPHGHWKTTTFVAGLRLSGFSFQPSLDKNRVMALAELQFIDRAEVVHLIGPPGTGKSHLSLALGVEAVKAGRSVYFGSLADIVATLAKAEKEGSLREKIRFFCRFALLIVDEIGYLPVIPGGGNLFFQLVNARYEKGAMILTSNRGFAEWGEIFGDPVVATALLDRLLHHAAVFQIEGSSYRLREHADLLPEHIRSKAFLNPLPVPATLKRRGRPPKNGGADHVEG